MTILDDILLKTRATIQADRASLSAQELESAVADLPPCRDFHAALAAGDQVNLIAEVKRASPSAGLIRDDFDAVQI
ncbi:MAG: indole-3-glycerol phosphate synthase, partial [Pirellulaceae bacterium]|nr:indole-3-glycerol phosphate synthase [Pirellulaceae bacterium]